MTISMSPDRNSFQRKCYLDRCNEDGEEPDAGYLKMLDKDEGTHKHKFDDPESRKHNLEYDLLTTDWILEKVRSSNRYAQNLYCAMCNMEWQSKDMWPTLKEATWGCSWRYAGGIIADMQQKGDYIDWYCSGISGRLSYDSELQVGYVSEGSVTEEIREDLDRLGWVPKPYKDDK